MLESGIDRIISQVVDPKINHIFRPQVEKAVHEFLATMNHQEETNPSFALPEEKFDPSVLLQGVPAVTTNVNMANDALSILETITSLNQEANATRASTEATNTKTNERFSKKLLCQHSLDGSIERDRNAEDIADGEKTHCNSTEESFELVVNCEDISNSFSSNEEGKAVSKEASSLLNPSKENVQESDEQKSKVVDKCDRKLESLEKGEKKKEKKDKSDKKDFSKRNSDDVKAKQEKTIKDKETEVIKHLALEKNSSKNKNESTKEVLEDSDMDILSDITVSSVHTSDLSSFEEDSEDMLSDSTEEGEIVSDDKEDECSQIKEKPEAEGTNDKKTKSGRHAYIHKPYLYSKYYSDSDDERTVEQRRQSVAREKEERFLRRQLNREKLEEKRKQKAAERTKSLKIGHQGKSVQNLEDLSRSFDLNIGSASIKDVLKEQRFLEKKVALSRKRKRESRRDEEDWKKKCEQPDTYFEEFEKINEGSEKLSSKEIKVSQGKNGNKVVRKIAELGLLPEENKNEIKVEKEHKRRPSVSSQMEVTQPDVEAKSQFERAEASPEPQKQRNILKNEKHIKKDESETPAFKNILKKETRQSKDKNEKERSLSEDKSLMKYKCKVDNIQKIGENVENVTSEKSVRNEETVLKNSQLARILPDDKTEKKNKHRSERKASMNSKEMKNISEKNESIRKENRKERQLSTEKSKAEYKFKKFPNDSRPPKESQSSSKIHVSSITSKRNEEEKHGAESSSLDHTLQQGDNLHQVRRRSKSGLEERIVLKPISKSYNKSAKIPESELQESLSKQESVQKLDKDKHSEESDPDKQSKFKQEMKVFEVNSTELEVESEAHSLSSFQKDGNHKVKGQLREKIREKSKSDKYLSTSRLERKLSADNHKSRNFKNNKDMKKKDDEGKSEDKGIKEVENSAKMSENLHTEKKPIKRLSNEHCKVNISTQEIEREGKISAFTSSFISLQNTTGHLLYSDQTQESMEECCSDIHNQQNQIEEESSYNLQGKVELKNIVKDQIHHHLRSEFSTTLYSNFSNTEEKAKVFSTKEINISSGTFRQIPKDLSCFKKEQYHINAAYEETDHILPDAVYENEKFHGMTEDSHSPKNLTSRDHQSWKSSSSIKSLSNERSYQKSINVDLPETTEPSNNSSEEESLNRSCVKYTISDSQTLAVKMKSHDNIVLNANPKDDIANIRIKNSEDTIHLPYKPVPRKRISAVVGIQEATVQRKTGSASTSILDNANLIDSEAAPTNISASKYVLINLEKAERDHFNENIAEYKLKPDKDQSIGNLVELSSGSVHKNVPGKKSKVSALTKGGNDFKEVAEDNNESGIVGSSIEGSHCIVSHSSMETDATVIGTSTERPTGNPATADSIRKKQGDEDISNLLTEGEAIITCSEEQRKAHLSCASIEADEGFTSGPWIKSKKNTHSVAEKTVGEWTVTVAEESGAVMEELAICESSSTSTKKRESGECTVNYAEESTKQVVNGRREDQCVNSCVTEEKDDAVTSASSEQKCVVSDCIDISKFHGATCTGEIENDGAVTSAGTEAQNQSMIGGNPVTFQSNPVRSQQAKVAEGTVTCTVIETEHIGSVICSVTGTDSQENAVTGLCPEIINNIATISHADKSEDIVNGESAVTSTGIIAEDDPACMLLEENQTGFVGVVDPVEKYQLATDSTEVRTETNVVEVSQGSYIDDEGCVTSTGEKQDDEEGENFVTSTGRGNEEAEHVLACIGTEDGMLLINMGITGHESSSICLSTNQLGTGLDEYSSNANKSSIDIMTCLSKEMKVDDIHNNIKGTVANSTTSVGISNENIMAFFSAKEDNSLFTETLKSNNELLSKQSINQPLVSEEKSENTESSLDNRKYGDLTKTVSKEINIVSASASENDKSEIELISTSTAKLCSNPAHSAKDNEPALPLVARTVENLEKVTDLLTSEDFSFPTPSTTVKYMNQDGDIMKSNKVSTSILEEFETPMPSIAVEDTDTVLVTNRVVEKNSTTEINAIHIPSVFTKGSDEIQLIGDKEERDECAAISTSIMEDIETPVFEEGNEDIAQCFDLRLEQITDTATISTSSAEHFEFSAEKQINQISVTEGKLLICNRVTHGVVVPIDTKHRSENTVVSREEVEKYKIVQEATSQESELHENNMHLLTEVGICHDIEFSTTNRSDQKFIASTAENLAKKTDRSGAGASEETPCILTNTEVEEKTSMCLEELDPTMLTDLKNNKNLIELPNTGQGIKKGKERRESSVISRTDGNSESIEISTNTVKHVNIVELSCAEISFDSSVSCGPSAETHMAGNKAEEDGKYVESLLKPAYLLEKEMWNEKIDFITHQAVLKTKLAEQKDVSNLSLLPFELGENSENAQCSKADVNAKVPETLVHGNTENNNDSKVVLPLESLEPRMETATDERLLCTNPEKELHYEEKQSKEVLKTFGNTHAMDIENQVLKEKLTEPEKPDQKEESFMPEATRNPTIEEGRGTQCQILEEEAKQEINEEKTANNSEEMHECPVAWKHSSQAVKKKDKIIGRVDISNTSGLESSLNPVEGSSLQQVIVKRKRGRPRKYPVETAAVQSQDSALDTVMRNVLQSSGTSKRLLIIPEANDFLNNRSNETEKEKSKMVMRLRGRKTKRSCLSSEETGTNTSESSKKHQKLRSVSEESVKGQDEIKEKRDNGETDGDEMYSGATTRSASRLEAERKQPNKPRTRATSKTQNPSPALPTNRQKLAEKKQSSATAKVNKSPRLALSKIQSTKRRREASPPVSSKKDHQRTDETDTKKSKR